MTPRKIFQDSPWKYDQQNAAKQTLGQRKVGKLPGGEDGRKQWSYESFFAYFDKQGLPVVRPEDLTRT